MGQRRGNTSSTNWKHAALGKTYVSFPSFDKIEPIEYLDNNDSSSDEEGDLSSALIVGLKDLETHFACINCSKSITANDEQTATCEACNVTQKIQNHSQTHCEVGQRNSH